MGLQVACSTLCLILEHVCHYGAGLSNGPSIPSIIKYDPTAATHINDFLTGVTEGKIMNLTPKDANRARIVCEKRGTNSEHHLFGCVQ